MPQLVVMAAGIGSRYGGLKQIEGVGPNNEILLDYSLFDAHAAGFRDIVFIIRRDIESAFKGRITRGMASALNIQYTFQEINDLPKGFMPPAGRTKPWGTAHAVLSARACVTEPFAVINADDFYGAESFKNLFAYLSTAADTNGVLDCCMVGYRLKNTLTEHGHVSRGICSASPDGTLASIVERTHIRAFGNAIRYQEPIDKWNDMDPDSIVSMNMFGYTPGFMDSLHEQFPAFLRENINNPKAEFFIPSVVNDLVARKKARVSILPTRDSWLGITYKDDAPKVRTAIAELVKSKAYPERLWE